MTNTVNQQTVYSKPIGRETLLALALAALKTGEVRFARQSALTWLSTFPGDLYVGLLLARSMAGDGKAAQAIPLLEKLLRADPEFVEAAETLRTLKPLESGSILPSRDDAPAEDWSIHFQAGKRALEVNQLDEAERLTKQALLLNKESPLPAIYHVQIARTLKDFKTAQDLARSYHEKWPECLHFALFLAEAQILNGEDNGAVSLLHQCAARDASGQVATRVWGHGHAFQTLWPDQLQVNFDLAVPASIAAVMGWNQLPPGTAPLPVEPAPTAAEAPSVSANAAAGDVAAVNTAVSTALNPTGDQTAQPAAAQEQAPTLKTRKEPVVTLKSIQDELEKVAKKLKQPPVSRADGRFPVYVIVTSRRALETQYGFQTAAIVDDLLKQLATAIRKRPNWGGIVFYPDDPACTATFGLKPVLGTDAWKIKLSLADLDRSLNRYGEMIGSVLIVGGSQVIPFHHLPNPVEDDDSEVLSDNPYATTDENYFVPEWPVGRLPTEPGPEPSRLLEKLRQMVQYHSDAQHTRRHSRLVEAVLRLFQRSANRSRPSYGYSRKVRPSFGMTAQVWKQSSQMVFSAIGPSKSLLASPPNATGCLNKSRHWPAQLGYFNLHGIPDSAEWYGQKEFNDDSSEPDYPIALSPDDLLVSGVPEVVFSEACYGAHIENKTAEDALALKFLLHGTLAMVGSTGIAYGTVTHPLIAADFLGHAYWQHLRLGETTGSAFMKAKLSLLREMDKRQGYLDGEDQKTLLSFVLYGDPLAAPSHWGAAPKALLRFKGIPVIKTMSDHKNGSEPQVDLPERTLKQVKAVVERYLPGLGDGDYVVLRQESTVAAPAPVGAAAKSADPAPQTSKRMVLALTKQVEYARKTHRHIARLTLDDHGKVVKISTSR